MNITICLYLIGIFLIGVPMAILSLWFYKTGEKLEDFPQAKKFLLKSIRNLLLPYFIFERGGWFAKNYPHEYRDCQPEIMTGIVKEEFFGSIDNLDKARCMTYIIISSVFWPVRVVWNSFVLGVGLVIGILCIPFLIPSWLTAGIRAIRKPVNG